MIIFGVRGVTSGRQQGEFFCPGCSGRRRFTHKRVRRFFTLYFIPVIPMDLLAEFVECQSCKRTYNKDVLSYDPQSQRAKIEAEFYQTVKRVMLEMMIADGQIHPSEIESIRQTFARLTAIELSPEEIRNGGEHIPSGSSNLEQQLSELAPCLNEAGKEAIIRAALVVALADGDFEEREQALLGRIGQALRMSSAHIRGVVSAFLQPGSAAT